MLLMFLRTSVAKTWLWTGKCWMASTQSRSSGQTATLFRWSRETCTRDLTLGSSSWTSTPTSAATTTQSTQPLLWETKLARISRWPSWMIELKVAQLTSLARLISSSCRTGGWLRMTPKELSRHWMKSTAKSRESEWVPSIGCRYSISQRTNLCKGRSKSLSTSHLSTNLPLTIKKDQSLLAMSQLF